MKGCIYDNPRTEAREWWALGRLSFSLPKSEVVGADPIANWAPRVDHQVVGDFLEVSPRVLWARQREFAPAQKDIADDLRAALKAQQSE